MRKIHNEKLYIYVDKLAYFNYDIVMSYSKMISQFILYSTGVDHADLEPFLAFKFNFPVKIGTLTSKLKGDDFKYFKCIHGFLRGVCSSEFSELNPEYSKTIKLKYKSAIQTPIIADVMNAYIQS